MKGGNRPQMNPCHGWCDAVLFAFTGFSFLSDRPPRAEDAPTISLACFVPGSAARDVAIDGPSQHRRDRLFVAPGL